MKLKILPLTLIISICATTLLSCGKPQEKIDSIVQDNVIENNDVAFEPILQSQGLAKALSTVFSKDENSITTEDCESVRFLSVGKGADGKLTLYAGFEDYSKAYFAELEKGENADALSLMDYVKTSPISLSDADNISNDLSLFKNVEVFELYDIKIQDISFIKSMENLYYGYFKNNGITDISALSDYNPSVLRELDFTGNVISDWTPAEHIKDKIIVNYSVQSFTLEDGNKIEIPMVIYLNDFLAQTQKQNTDTVQTDNEDSSSDGKTASDGQIDWSVLFE